MRVANLKLGEKYKLVRFRDKFCPIIYYDVISVSPLWIHCYSHKSDWECFVKESWLDSRMQLVTDEEFDNWLKYRNEL